MEDDLFRHYGIYCVSALVGVGGSALLITSLTLTADLIGPNVETGAFVYGAMSLSDKLSNGAAFALVQLFIPPHDVACVAPACRAYFRDVLFLVCGGAAAAAAVFALSIFFARRFAASKISKGVAVNGGGNGAIKA